MKNVFQIAIVLILIMGSCSKKTFKASENSLQEDGKMASLVKIQPESITDKYWKLIELFGKPVVRNDSFKREPFIILQTEGNRVNGNGGCNTLTGTYEITPASLRIKFSQMATTMMMCLNMEVEEEMKKALGMVDNYTLTADGKYLSLNRARMAPLARFEIVYLK